MVHSLMFLKSALKIQIILVLGDYKFIDSIKYCIIWKVKIKMNSWRIIS
jgi:hypothetical protein